MGEIVFNNVSKEFGAVKAVDDISFKVKDGEFLTLLGPSGCGKSTTLNLIAGMLAPSHGDIFINEQLVNEIPCNKRNIGMVFQSYALFPHMTVFDNVAFGLRMKKYPKKSIASLVNDALKLVNMVGYEQRKPAELSGGQQQRIALARALVFDPDVLLLDEPLSNLDAKLRESVGFELKQLHEKTKKTIVYVTHDQIEALTMSDRIVLMNHGKIEQEGDPVDLYTSPKSLFAADFIGANSFIDCVVSKVSDSVIEVMVGKSSIKCAAVPGVVYDVGVPAKLAIRPESIELINEKEISSFRNILDGTIINKEFRGSNTLFYLGIGNHVVKAESSPDKVKDYKLIEGSQIKIGFNDSIVFKKN